MGYFDKLVDVSFKKRDDGKLVYYPYGNFGPKYIISKDSEARIRVFLKIYYIFATIPVFLVILNRNLISFISLILIVVFYLIGITVILSNSDKVVEK